MLSAAIESGALEIVFSEPVDLATASAITLDGTAITGWVASPDGYAVTAPVTVTRGSHTLTIGTTVTDLAGTALAATTVETFDHPGTSARFVVLSTLSGLLSTTSTVGNDYGYHGRRHDVETGLVYFLNRYFDPEPGRFISSNPVGYVDGPNLYQFVLMGR